MRITTIGGLAAIQPTDDTVVIIGRDGDFAESDFKDLIIECDINVMITSRSWDYAEQDGLVVWSIRL